MAKTLKAQLENEVVSVHADTPLVDALKRMRHENIGALLVRNLKGEFIGIFTERDLLKKIEQIRGYDGWLKPVGLVASKPLITCPIKQFEKAAGLMLKHDIRHMPLTVGKEVVAIVSMRDLFRNVVETGVLTVFTPIADHPGKTLGVVGGTPGFVHTIETIAGLKEMGGSIAGVKSYTALEFLNAKLERSAETVILVDLDFVDAKHLKAMLQRIQSCTRDIQVIALYSPLLHPPEEERALKRMAQQGGMKTLTKPVVMKTLLELMRDEA
jgi:CBS domain-containing protein